MKQTWKKLSGLVLAGAMAVSLTACGSSEEAINATVAENLYSTSVSVMESLVTYDNASIEKFMEENPNMDDFSKNAYTSWHDSSEELGAYQGYQEVTDLNDVIKKDGTNYVVTLDAEFENGDATVEFVYDSKLTPESVGFSKEYTMSQKMESAGMNTIAGLGTVFIILIFLSFVISLLKYVPQFVESFGKKKEAEQAQSPAVESQQASVAEALPEEELVDDGELVAVIAAAIATAENTSADGFVVRSIRKSNRRNWRSI